MKKPTIIVSGALANKLGQGGEAWVRLNWVLGFKKLGFEVLFLEQMDKAPNPDAVAYFQHVTAQFGLSDAAALLQTNGRVLAGVPLSRIEETASRAEALINISGHLTFEPVFARVQPRVYVDIDPGFTQFWHASGTAGARLERHDIYFTIGQNIGTRQCEIPSSGIDWRHTRPPVVLEHWPLTRSSGTEMCQDLPGDSTPPGHRIRFTTVANWRGSFGPIQFAGKSYGLKVHEFRKCLELPRRSRRHFEIALQIHPGDKNDLDALLANEWRIVDSQRAAESPDDFRSYVQNSGAEFSVAQGVYVGTQCGWFSDRTVGYLASGKPALVQDTGFSTHIPAGVGLVAFRTLDEAVDGAERICSDYQKHCRAARALAEEYFDSNKVLRNVIEEVGIGGRARVFAGLVLLWIMILLRSTALAGVVTKSLPHLDPISPEQPFTFAVFGDSRGNDTGEQPEAHRQILRAINQVAPNLALNTGDMIYGHTTDEGKVRRQWRWYQETVAQLRSPLFHAPGNHDIWDKASAQWYHELCGPAHYAFDYGSARFIVLDSETEPGRIGPEQFKWLKEQLAGSSRQKVFVFVHQPLFPSSAAAGSSLDRSSVERDQLHQLFVQQHGRIKGVFQGHEHLYHFSERDGVPYYITGGGGANLYVLPELGGFYHFLLVRVDGERVTVEIRKTGPLLEPLSAPVRLLPGTLLETWEHGLFWYTWDHTVRGEITQEHASEGKRGMRLNFDLAANAWPVLALRHAPVSLLEGVESLSMDIYVPPDFEAPLGITTTLEDSIQHTAPPFRLKGGWNAVRTDLKTLVPAGWAMPSIKNLSWTLTSTNHALRGYIVFDNFRVAPGAGASRAGQALLESWETSLPWRVFDETVTAEPSSQSATDGLSSAKIYFDSQHSRMLLLARLNPPWNLESVGTLLVDVFVPETLTAPIEASLTLRSQETDYSGPAVPLGKGWTTVAAALGGGWLPQEARTAAEQVQWTLNTTNGPLTGWVLFDNLRTGP